MRHVSWQLLMLCPLMLTEQSSLADSITPVKRRELSPAEAQYRQGVVALAKGNLDAAEKLFQESLRLTPGQVSSILGLANVAEKRNDQKKAQDYFQQALSKEPNSSKVQTSWGHFLATQRRFSEAETALQKAISLNNRAIPPRVELGDVYLFGMKQPEKAVGSLRSALEIDPKSATTHYKLALALTAMKQPKEALKEIDAALRLNPAYIDAHLTRGDLLLVLGEGGQSLAAFEQAVKVSPKHPVAWVKMGMAYEKQSRVSDAEKAYLTAISLDGRQAIAYNNLAWLAIGQNQKKEQALHWAKRAVELVPEAPQFLDTLGWVHRWRGELTLASSVLKKASLLKPELPEVFYHLGVVCADASNGKDAQVALGKALALRNDFPGAEDARRRLAALK